MRFLLLLVLLPFVLHSQPKLTLTGPAVRPGSPATVTITLAGGLNSASALQWFMPAAPRGCGRQDDHVRVNDTLPLLSPCDLNGDGKIDTLDARNVIDQIEGVIPAVTDFNGDGKTNAVDLQRVVNASVDGVCRVG